MKRLLLVRLLALSLAGRSRGLPADRTAGFSAVYNYNGVTIQVNPGTSFAGIRERQPGPYSLAVVRQSAAILPLKVTQAGSGAE
jgi:hypothetical protein